VLEISHAFTAMQLAKIIARKRGLDPFLSALTGLFHDWARVLTGDNDNHAERGYEPVKTLLLEEGLTPEQAEKIAIAVKNHSKKDEEGSPLEELIKDVDVFDSSLYGLIKDDPAYTSRLERVKQELGEDYGKK